MISEGSCDTEDWSNDAENSALITKLQITIKTVIWNCNNISIYYCFYCIFLSNKCKIKLLIDPKLVVVHNQKLYPRTFGRQH